MDTMLSVDDGRRRILGSIEPLQPIELPLADAFGCVSAREVVTEYDIPAFSSATADGFAVREADIHGATPDATADLRVAGWALSGRPPEATVGWGEAVRIAAGAPLPAGADCVVPVDRVEVEGEMVRVHRPVKAGEFVRRAGEDVRAGDELVPAGRRLSAPELGMLATAGYGTVLAYPRVRVSVVSVGSALVEPGRPAGFGQLRDAASYAIVGGLRDVGAVPYRIPIVHDVERELREALLSDLSRADAFICAGGVAEDESEAVTTALAELGDVVPQRTAMYPGGTMGFGMVDGKPFFSLPSDALSAFITFEVFVRPSILKTMGRRDLQRPEVRAVLDEELTGPSDVTLYVPGRVEHREGAWHVRPTGTASPNLLGALVRANGLVVIPPADTASAAGEQVSAQIFRPLER